MLNLKYALHFLSLFLILNFVPNMSSAMLGPSSNDWLSEQTTFAYQKIVDNLSPADGLKGSVIASTSNQVPDYHFHWVRDAGLVMDALTVYYQQYATNHERQQIREFFNGYINFSILIQNAGSLTGLGEPKFYVDGSPFNGPWARPQNDSPSLRAISLIHWAEILIKEGKTKEVKKTLYSSEIPATLPIKNDLEYIAHHWQDFTFDLWEEVKATHFYTLMVERHALLDGAKLAGHLGDKEAAQFYTQQAKKIEKELQKFWSEEKGHFVATTNFQSGVDYKISNIDSAVVLGLLHGDRQDGFLSWDDPRVIKTMYRILDKFSGLYQINQRPDIPGIAIGRYPEDKYNGTDFNGGNPWVLCTLGLAEGFYRYAHLVEKNDEESARHAKLLANTLVDRVNYHANKDGSLSEQIDRFSGYMISAENLTWNYAALITTRYAKR